MIKKSGFPGIYVSAVAGRNHLRTFWGRVAHALVFELVLLGICTPVLALIFNESLAHTGMLSIGLSLTAMLCNGVYNYIFDIALVYMKRPLYPRSFNLRCVHSILFEICLMILTLPMIMWWMNFSFFQAFALDISFSVTVPIYALVFNWVYDLLIPAPVLASEKAN